MKLSEDLAQCNNSGDFGLALYGYAERAEKLEKALMKIAKWHGEFPDTGLFFDKEKTRHTSYGYEIMRKKAAQIWRITLDRYSSKQISKSGKASSIYDIFDCFFDKYMNQDPKPIVEVSTSGIGEAFAGLLTERKIPFVEVKDVLMRIDGADIYKRKA